VRSISTRLIIGTSLVLSVFVILTALSVSYSVKSRAETARFDRLQGLIYGILGATEISEGSAGPSLLINDLELPDPRLNQTTTGLYAEIVGSDGKALWQSRSSLVNQPAATIRPIGDWFFETVEGQDHNQTVVNRLQLSTAWEFENGEESF